MIDRKRPDQAGRAGRPLQSLQQCRNASRQLVRAGGSQPVTAKHSCAQRRWSALDSETAWCSCLQRREQLDKRAGHPGEVRSSTAHSEGLGRSPQVPSCRRARKVDEGRASVNAGAKPGLTFGVREFVRAFSIAAPDASLGVRKPVRIFYCCAQPPDTFPIRQVTPSAFQADTS